MIDERAIVRAPSQSAPDPRRSGDASAGSPWRENAYAVVIGINEYVDRSIQNLRFARPDAEAVYAVLTDPGVGRFKPENVTLLVDGQATERNIRSALGTTLPRRAGKDSTVVIYYAGHGAPVIDPRAKSVDGVEKYLVPCDAIADDLRSSAIKMDSVQEYFSLLDASQVICFLDTCYSGSAGGRSFDNPAYQTRAMPSDEFLDDLAGEGRFVVTACAPNEVSLESPTWGHGIFTHFLVDGLSGKADVDLNGKVTIDELYTYLYENVGKAARELGGSMKPVKKGSVSGTIYLTEYETPAKKRIGEALRSASDAMAKGDDRAALVLYHEVLSLDAGNAVALAAVADAQEAESKRAADIKQRQNRLLGYLNRGELSMRDYDRALTLLDTDPETLSRYDAEYRRLVDGLVAGDLTVASFTRSLELLDIKTGDQPQMSAASRPDVTARPSAPPKSARPEHSAPTAPPANHSRKFITIGGVTAAVVLAIVLWRGRSPGHDTSSSVVDSASASSPPADAPSVKRKLDSSVKNNPPVGLQADSAPKPHPDALPAAAVTQGAGQAGAAHGTGPVASIHVQPTFATVAGPGKTLQLVASATNKTGELVAVGISWRTSDATVAVVSATGLVTAIKTGTAVITASSAGITQSIAVTVQPPGG